MIRREDIDSEEAVAGTGTAVLTEEEMSRLSALLRRYGYQPLYVELGMDIRRLAFARWRVQRGILNEGNEGLEHAGADETGDERICGIAS